MSDEQLQAHGLPRREFLKRAAIGAGVFAAPVIVSFGLGGTAEAANGCFPNQSFANQAQTMGTLVITIWSKEQQSLIDHNIAKQLRGKLLDAEGRLLNGEIRKSCDNLDDFRQTVQRQSGKGIDPGVATQLYQQSTNVFNQIGCPSCT